MFKQGINVEPQIGKYKYYIQCLVVGTCNRFTNQNLCSIKASSSIKCYICMTQSQYDSDSLALLLFHDKNNFPVLSTCQPSCFVCDTSHFGESYVRMISCGIDMWPVVTKSRELFLFVCNCLFVFRLLFFWIESFENIIIIKSAPTSKNAVSAFQITCTLLSVTLNDS